MEWANRCSLGLRQVYWGTFTDELLNPGTIWGSGPMPSTMEGDLSRLVLEGVRRPRPPPSTPDQEAAILRLQSAASVAENQSRSTCSQRLAELRRRCAGGRVRLPDRGGTVPAHGERVALPPPGSTPGGARSVSPKAVRMLDDFQGETLKENCEECVRGSEVDPVRAARKAKIGEGEPSVSLRPVFERCRFNLRGRAPSRCVTEGVSAMSSWTFGRR